MSSPVALSVNVHAKYTQSVGQINRLKFYQRIFVIITLPEASPEPSSRQRRSRGCGYVLSEPEPVRLIYVKRLPSGSRSPCSPGCPLRLPVLLDDA